MPSSPVINPSSAMKFPPNRQAIFAKLPANLNFRSC
jgi:hypothetical protein